MPCGAMLTLFSRYFVFAVTQESRSPTISGSGTRLCWNACDSSTDMPKETLQQEKWARSFHVLNHPSGRA